MMDIPDEKLFPLIDLIQRVGMEEPGLSAQEVWDEKVVPFLKEQKLPVPKGALEEAGVEMVRKTRHQGYKMKLEAPRPGKAAEIAAAVSRRVAAKLSVQPGIMSAAEILDTFSRALRVECVEQGVVPPYRATLDLTKLGGDPDQWIATQAKEMVSTLKSPIFAFNCHPLLKVDEIEGLGEEGMEGPFKADVARRMAAQARGEGYLVVCVGHPFPRPLQTREAAEAIREDMMAMDIPVEFVVLVDEDNDPADVVSQLNGGNRVRYVDFATDEV